MKKIVAITILFLVAALLLAGTRALARPLVLIASATGNPHNTEEAASSTAEASGVGKTPGARATEQAGKHGLRGKPTILRGTISAVDASSLSLALEDGSSATVGLTPATKIHVPGPSSMGDTLAVGMRAIVMALTDPNANVLVARMVISIPGQPVRAHRVGKVTSYTPGASITILATDGASYTFGLSPDTKILPQDRLADLAIGSLVTVIAPRLPASQVWAAKGLVVHPPTQ